VTRADFVKYGTVPVLVGNETVEASPCVQLGVHVSPLSRLRPLLAAAMVAVFDLGCEQWPTYDSALMVTGLKKHGAPF
jgi:hypothetical protein